MQIPHLIWSYNGDSGHLLQVYKLVFGSYPDSLRVRRSLTDYRPDLQTLAEHFLGSDFSTDMMSNYSDLIKSALSEMIPDFENGLLSELMMEPALWHDKKLIGFLLQVISQSGSLDFPQTLSPSEIAEILKVCMFAFICILN